MQILATYVFNIEIVKYYYQYNGKAQSQNSLAEIETWLRLFGMTFVTPNAQQSKNGHIIVMSAVICISSTYKLAA